MQDIEFIPIPRQIETITVETEKIVTLIPKMLLAVACLISLLVGIALGVIGYVIF